MAKDVDEKPKSKEGELEKAYYVGSSDGPDNVITP